jgi:hypothetical protein
MFAEDAYFVGVEDLFAFMWKTYKWKQRNGCGLNLCKIMQ